jgi:hypothetical protein
MDKRHADIVASVLADNEEVLMENGPTLSYRMRSVVLAKDEAKGKVCVGGLGSLGVGKYWTFLNEGVKTLPGYTTAPSVSYEDDSEATALHESQVCEALALARWRDKVEGRSPPTNIHVRCVNCREPIKGPHKVYFQGGSKSHPVHKGCLVEIKVSRDGGI